MSEPPGDSGLRLVEWNAWQGEAIRRILDKRRGRGGDLERPVVLSWIALPVNLDQGGRFSRFADAVGGARAEAHYLRVLQAAALSEARLGIVRVPRGRFGRVVLSRPWDDCSRAMGERVYDGLIESGLAVPIDPAADGSPAGAPASGPGGVPGGGPAGVPEGGPAGNEDGKEERARTLPLPPPHSRNGAESASPGRSTADLSAVPGALRDSCADGRGGVSPDTWEREMRALLADGVAADQLTAVLARAPRSAKPWEVFRGLRETASLRAKEARALDANRAERRRVALEESAVVRTWSPERQALWLDAKSPARRGLYIETLISLDAAAGHDPRAEATDGPAAGSAA